MQQKLIYLFTFLFIISSGSISLAQNAPVDFEDGGFGATWTWTTFNNGDNTAPEIIPNPDMTGANTSATVAKFTTLLAGDPWAGFYSDDIGEFTFDETNSTVKIMVWKPIISNFGIKFEGAGAPIEVLVQNTVINEWEELTFDFTGQIGNTFNRLVFLPDFGPDTRTQDNTLYLDNLTFSEGTATPPVNVTFKVDMKQEASTGAFVAADHKVEVRGSFNGWDFGDNRYLLDPDGDLIYELEVPSPANETTFYKFFHTGGDTWEGDPNREVVVAEDAIVLDPIYFNKRIGTGVPTSITFEVDMSVIEQGAFDVGMPVKVAGSFTDWGNSAFDLTDGDGDLVYTGTFTQDDTGADLLSGTALVFKFIFDDGSNLQWESEIKTTGDNNRFTYLEDGDNTFSALWNNTSGAEFADGNITFNVDMSVMTEVGVFDANSDQMQVRGGFNGWGDADPTISHMNQDFLDPNQWFLEIPFVGQQVGSQLDYKFYVNIDSASTPEKFGLWTDGWERPFAYGGGNRPVLFEGGDQNVEKVFYDGVLPAYVVDQDGIEITFSIDMTVAADPDQQVPTFNPATDTVWWVSEQPAFAYSQGWVDTDHMKVLPLTDTDGDMVYKGTLTITAPSWNGFEYRYGFSNGGDLTLETAGFGAFAYRVRYIEQNGYRSFVQPYSAPQDNWFLTENKSSEWEEEPAGDIVGVKETNLVANKFSLNQNYPNPFNPTTQIRFSIPSANVVTLKVFNLLGEEVKTLINESMNVGSYEINFNASNLASGLYLYTLTAGDFVSTKKMLLLK